MSTKHKKIIFTLAGIALLATCCFFGVNYPRRKAKNVFIIGPSGSGKTTTALYLLNKKLKHTDGNKIDLADAKDPLYGRIGTPTEEVQYYTSEEDGITYCECSKSEPGAVEDGTEFLKIANAIRTCGRQGGARSLVFTLEDSGRNMKDKILEVAILLHHLFPTLDSNQEKIMPSIFFVVTKTDDTSNSLLESLVAAKTFFKKYTPYAEADKKEKCDAYIKRLEKVCDYILKNACQRNNAIYLSDPTKQDQTLRKKIKQANSITSDLFNPKEISLSDIPTMNTSNNPQDHPTSELPKQR